jgi:diguanylate cyclase (GGDEF)-like protein
VSSLEAENRELRRRLATMEQDTSLTLARATRLSQIVSVLGHTDLGEVVTRASVTIAELFSVDIAMLMLGADDRLEVASQSGLRPQDVPQETFALGALGELMAERPVIAGPAASLALPDWLARYRPRHVACARLVVGEESLGLIWLVRRSDMPFGSSDESELRAVAQRLALAVQNGLLNKRMTAQILVLRRMHAFTVDLAGMLEVAAVAQRIVDAVVLEAQVGAAAVLLDATAPVSSAGAVLSDAWTRYPITTTSGRLGELAIREDPADLSEQSELLQHIVGLAGLALEKALLYEQSRDQARRDSLTGLLGHRAFHEALAALQDRGEPFAAVVADVDDFKLINDLHGHSIGDDALRAVARTMSAEVRAADTVYRVGGEEFCVLLPGLAAGDASIIAERLRAQVSTIVAPVALTVSLGVASFPDAAFTGEGVFDRADAALYAAKRAGKNQTTIAGRPATGPVEIRAFALERRTGPS